MYPIVGVEADVLTAAATAIVQQGPFAALAYFLLRYILNTFAERMEDISEQMAKQFDEVVELRHVLDGMPNAIKAAIYECMEMHKRGGKNV